MHLTYAVQAAIHLFWMDKKGKVNIKTIYDTPTYDEYVGINWGWKGTFAEETKAGSMTWYYWYGSFVDNKEDYDYAESVVYGFN